MKISSFCILGRPNVGKSTFFNCLSKKKTITKGNEAGVTRDCNKTLVEYQEFNFSNYQKLIRDIKKLKKKGLSLAELKKSLNQNYKKLVF